MRHPEFQSYVFEKLPHWRAGAYSNFEASDEGLRVPAGWVWEPVPDTDSTDASPALAFDACGRLHWLRPTSRELVRLYDFGPQCIGSLLDAEDPRALVVGGNRLWLLKSEAILRYAERDLALLGQIETRRDVLAITGDRGDGLWLLESGDGQPASVRRLDGFGCAGSDRIVLPKSSASLSGAALGTSYDGQRLAVLGFEDRAKEWSRGPCHPTGWRLFVVETTERQSTDFSEISAIDPAFQPRLLAVDREDRIHLVDPVTAQLWTLSFAGELIFQHAGSVPGNRLPVRAISAHDSIALMDGGGLAWLRASDGPERERRETTSVFITPTLVSPDGARRGWTRADVEVELSEGTTLEVTYSARGRYSATESQAAEDREAVKRVNAILAAAGPSPAVKAAALERELPWADAKSDPKPSIFAGTATDSGVVRRRYLLHEIDKAYLWLRLTCYTPPGREPPKLKSLAVHYPDLSYLRYLPAIYQEDSASVAQLRRFLALFESLFGDLDAIIDRLPRAIDPETAPPERLAFLLRWLGLPVPQTLAVQVQRNLLRSAPELLAERGTQNALIKLLEILTEGASLAVEDRAAGPAPWVLPEKSSTSHAPRLGCDTLLAARQPPAFCLGMTSRLGATPLGAGHIDPIKTFAHPIGELRIRIAADEAGKACLEPLVRHFLPYFVPAHCRYRLEFVRPASWPRGRFLDGNLRLAKQRNSRLGDGTVLGCFSLPAAPFRAVVLDRGAYLNRGQRLA